MPTLLLLFSCRPADTHTEPHPKPNTDQGRDTGTVEHSAFTWVPHSAEHGHTGHTAIEGPDCENLLGPPFEVDSTTIIRTEEDFDFDNTEYLLTQAGTSLAGINRYGEQHIVVPQIGVDAAGIRSLPDGDILIAQPDTGTVRLVNYQTGGSTPVLTSLQFPNGLEVSSAGVGYVSEFVAGGGIREFDPRSGANHVILGIDFPNNMTLSPDEQVLYILTSTQQFWGASKVMALDRNTDGTWARNPREIKAFTTFLGGIAVDVCGNLYVTEYMTGRVARIRMPEATLEPIAELTTGGYQYNGGFSAARFSPGFSGWSPTQLYVTNRAQLYTIELGIEGRHVLK